MSSQLRSPLDFSRSSQRIRRAIEHLQSVETMLGGIVPTDTTAPPPPPAAEPTAEYASIDQDVIDRLIGA